MASIEKERVKTKRDLDRKLKKYGRCALVRPTGFGKTWLLTEMIKEYKHVLYLYPSEVIRQTVAEHWKDVQDYNIDPETLEMIEKTGNLPNADMMTYMKLIRLSGDDMKKMDYDLVIFDEAHKLGGTMTKESVAALFRYLPNAHFIGATATPERSDTFDYITAFFNNVCVYPYTLHDAFKDHTLQIPYYAYAIYDTDEIVRNEKRYMTEGALTAGEDINDMKVREVVKSRLIEISKLFNVPNVIKETMEASEKDPDYQKYIVFFSCLEALKNNLPKVVSWFKEAYPDHEINTLEVSTRNQETDTNVDNLKTLVKRPKTIDLIACIDKLNVGYHVEITGIMMYRGTSSDTIYIQQLGRALSSGQKDPCIVLDVVDNLHRKGLYELNLEKKVPGTHAGGDHNTNGTDGDKDDGTDSGNNHGDGIIVDGPNTFGGDDGTDGAGDVPPFPDDPWWTKANELTPEDFHIVSSQATYREMIAKVVAEPMAQRCKEAFTEHMKRWCRQNNIKFPVSDAELINVYNMPKEQFIAFFDKLIKDNKMTYPMHDADKLLKIGRGKTKDGKPDGIPMGVFAQWKNTSVGNILDLLDIPNDMPRKKRRGKKSAA